MEFNVRVKLKIDSPFKTGYSYRAGDILPARLSESGQEYIVRTIDGTDMLPVKYAEEVSETQLSVKTPPTFRIKLLKFPDFLEEYRGSMTNHDVEVISMSMDTDPGNLLVTFKLPNGEETSRIFLKDEYEFITKEADGNE